MVPCLKPANSDGNFICIRIIELLVLLIGIIIQQANFFNFKSKNQLIIFLINWTHKYLTSKVLIVVTIAIKPEKYRIQ